MGGKTRQHMKFSKLAAVRQYFFGIRHVRHQANTVTHNLAKLCLSISQVFIWDVVSGFLSSLQEDVLSDLIK